MKRRALIGVVGLALLVPLAARAQEVNLSALDPSSNVVQLRTGAEYGFVAGVGVGRVFSLRDRPVLAFGDFSLPWAGLDLSDYRLRVGALVPVLESRHWKLAGSLAPTVRGTSNDISRMTGVGADLGVVGGYYRRQLFVAAELGFDWAVTTHVTHSAAYRSAVYQGARDGWYANPGGNARAGLQGGASFGRYDVTLRVGAVRDVDGNPPLLPFYGTLALATHW